ncbi:hypothetical protein ACFZC6_02100 [Streptomyces ossamyceticus]|uniref:hypothetical protein n=1 Tax=Streptomyces ossamyceticus TaxID=249581 RepID=UPI0036E18073
MNADPVLCPVNPIGHEWDGLGCRWCPATRTAGEAIVSGLAGRRGGTLDGARKLLDSYRAEVTVEVLRGAVESTAEIHARCHRTVCAGCEVRRDILDVLTSVADVIGAGGRDA